MTTTLPRTWGRHRASPLRLEHASDRFPVHVTLGTHRRRAVFSVRAIARPIFRMLKTHERTLAAVVMPDHAHWILDCAERTPRAVTDFKSLSTRLAWERGVRGKLWQRSYFDHVLRDRESLVRTVRYVLANPIRAGLAGRAGEYRWSYDRFGLSG